MPHDGLDPLAVLRSRPERAAVLVDFDGTLAPIVPTASDARPLPGVREVLERLSASYAMVAVVSGRPVAYLTDQLGPVVRLVGLYGLEWSDGDRILEHPAAGPWRAVIDAVAVEAKAALPAEVDVEHKGLSLTLHFRPAPEAAAVTAAWAAEAAGRSGLHERMAKMSIELHPPIAVDKGTTVRDLAAGLDAACYLGDDVGDLPAFAALDTLADGGLRTVKIAVRGVDAAPALLAAADVVVDGPPAALDILRSLL